MDLPALLKKKSYFLFGPRLTGKTSLTYRTLKDARVYDLLDTSIYLALSQNPLKIGFHVPDGVWQVCFYMVDYDSQARPQVLELPGWANQTVSGFGDGATVCYPGLMGGDFTLKVRSTAGPNSVISSIGWVRLDGQGQPVTDPELCAGLGECEPCSYTQGGWGQTAKGGNVGVLRDAHFSEIYPAGVTVGQATCSGGAAGSGNVMTFSRSLAVENFLPCGGTPDVLSKDYSNPTCSL